MSDLVVRNDVRLRHVGLSAAETTAAAKAASAAGQSLSEFAEAVGRARFLRCTPEMLLAVSVAVYKTIGTGPDAREEPVYNPAFLRALQGGDPIRDTEELNVTLRVVSALRADPDLRNKAEWQGIDVDAWADAVFPDGERCLYAA